MKPDPRPARLATRADAALAFVDVGWPSTHGWRRLDRLCRAVPDVASRQRITPSRLEGGHVSPQDRAWARSLGFADLVPSWTDRGAGALRLAITRALAQVGAPPPAPEDLVPHVGASSATGSAVPARALVQSPTGEAPEDLAARLGSILDVGDRRWGPADYPRRVVGSEAVEALMRARHRSRDEVMATARALGKPGLLVHMVRERPFPDRKPCYRLAWSPAADAVDAADVWRRLVHERPGPTATRHHPGPAYPDGCVGGEVVTLLARRFGSDRVDAWLLMHRTAQRGFVEPVANARPFLDGHFFHRRTAEDIGQAGAP